MPNPPLYRITFTDSRHIHTPKVTYASRLTDQAATRAAKTRLFYHRTELGDQWKYDGWDVWVQINTKPYWKFIAEVRPGYDSRKQQSGSQADPVTPPF